MTRVHAHRYKCTCTKTSDTCACIFICTCRTRAQDNSYLHVPHPPFHLSSITHSLSFPSPFLSSPSLLLLSLSFSPYLHVFLTHSLFSPPLFLTLSSPFLPSTTPTQHHNTHTTTLPTCRAPVIHKWADRERHNSDTSTTRHPRLVCQVHPDTPGGRRPNRRHNKRAIRSVRSRGKCSG